MIFRKIHLPFGFKSNFGFTGITEKSKEIEKDNKEPIIEFEPSFIQKSRIFFKTIMILYILYNMITIALWSDTNLPFSFGLNEGSVYHIQPELGITIFNVLLAPILSIILVLTIILLFFMTMNGLLILISTVLATLDFTLIKPIFGVWFFFIIYRYVIKFIVLQIKFSIDVIWYKEPTIEKSDRT